MAHQRQKVKVEVKAADAKPRLWTRCILLLWPLEAQSLIQPAMKIDGNPAIIGYHEAIYPQTPKVR